MAARFRQDIINVNVFFLNRQHLVRIVALVLAMTVAVYWLFSGWRSRALELDPDFIPRNPGLLRNRTGLEARQRSFWLDGKKFTFQSGAMHYFRVVPEYWKDRMLKMKAAGLNALETYCPWNLHEEIRGTFNFKGMLNVRKYIQLAQEVGLYVILRPGPYICSEWDLGGLPSWLLSDPNMKVRSTYQPYLKAMDRYMEAMAGQVADLQYKKGGAIIALQLENEFGSYGQDNEYMKNVKMSFQKHGLNELLFTSDNDQGTLRGSLPDVLATANFNNPQLGKQLFTSIRKRYPEAPLATMEFWTGWFDIWGSKHHTTDPNYMVSAVDFVLQQGASINFYMFHGGTNFGFMNGANGNSPYTPQTTSYDYDSPISEQGLTTTKFFKLQKLLQTYSKSSAPSPSLPPPILAKAYGSVPMKWYLPLEKILSLTKSVKSSSVVPMEMLDINNGGGQGYGFILYRKRFSVSESGKQLQIIGNIKDRAQILLNGLLLKTFDWRNIQRTSLPDGQQAVVVDLDMKPGENIVDVMVENTGRVNYASSHENIMNTERKGLLGKVQLDGKEVKDWEIFPLEFKQAHVKTYTQSVDWKPMENIVKVNGPVLVKGQLDMSETPQDTFIFTQGWGKGCVFVNNFNLGRYWNVGPTKTLYLPAPLLNKGLNQILVFETNRPQPQVTLIEKPDLG